MTTLVREEWVGPAQAGRLLGVGTERVRQLCDEGKLNYQMTALGRLIRKEDVEALAAQRAEDKTEKARARAVR